MAAIILEVVVAILIVGLGAAFWSAYKAPKYLRKMLDDENELKRILISETGELQINNFENGKPMPGDYFIERIDKILGSCRNEYNKFRYVCLTIILLLIGASVFLGKIYLALNVLVFVLLSGINAVEPVKKKLADNIIAVATGIAKWHGTNSGECGDYCNARTELKLLHAIVAGYKSKGQDCRTE